MHRSSDRTFRGGARGSTYDVRSDLAAGDSVHSNHFGGGGVRFGIRRRVMEAQWMEVVTVWMAERCGRTPRAEYLALWRVLWLMCGWCRERPRRKEGAWADDVGAST